MGAYSTDQIVDAQMRDWLLTHIARPVVAGMKAEGAEYKGILYCGLMMTARGPMVLEFNCRFGDPETQPILMRMESDLVEAILASIDGRVSEGAFRWSRAGGLRRDGLRRLPRRCQAANSSAVWTARSDIRGQSLSCRHQPWRRLFHTSGGRVLGVTARGKTCRMRWSASMTGPADPLRRHSLSQGHRGAIADSIAGDHPSNRKVPGCRSFLRVPTSAPLANVGITPKQREIEYV